MHFAKILVFVSFLACLNSCKKDSLPVTATLSGTWELTQMQSGMIPTINYSPGNGNLIKFTNNTYENYANNVLVNSGTFTIVDDSTVMAEVGLTIPAGQYSQRIDFENTIRGNKQFFQITGNTLSFVSGYFPLDGGSFSMYKKIK